MAQLIKLYDYISRYESNPFHYPAQYIRLKRENWQQVYEQWETKLQNRDFSNKNEVDNIDINDTQSYSKWSFFKKKSSIIEDESTTFPSMPIYKTELTQYFLDQLLPLQIKWATSTISHCSYTAGKPEQDGLLTYLLQRFPDIYLVMYYPIFRIKNASVEAEIILISPLGIEIIKVLDIPENTIVNITNDRVWTYTIKNKDQRIISPIISLRRTEHIVKGILQQHDIDFPIEKTVLVQHSRILADTNPYQIKLIDNRSYSEWFTQKRSLNSPLKSIQLRVMNALLSHCQTTAVRRPEWTEEQDIKDNHTDTGEV